MYRWCRLCLILCSVRGLGMEMAKGKGKRELWRSQKSRVKQYQSKMSW